MTHAVTERSHLIIGGATKSGSTSLFHYLADHPDICTTYRKETRFFLDDDYPSPVRYRLEDGLDRYAAYFAHCGGDKILLDSSPQYLYSPGTPERLQAVIPQVKLLFILRDPIDRLVSFYRFAQQRSFIGPAVSFRDYVDEQLTLTDAVEPQPPDYLRALPHGCSSHYLINYLNVFPAEQLLVLRFEDLKENPLALMQRICHFVGIDESFYSDYSFRVYNPTRVVRINGLQRAYLAARRALSRTLQPGGRLFAAGERLHLRLKPHFLRWNSQPVQEFSISPELRVRLDAYYRGENERLAGILARSIVNRDESRAPAPVEARV